MALGACWAGAPRARDGSGDTEPITESGRLHVDGHERTFAYYAPTRLASGPALLLAFHGSRESGQKFRRRTRYAFDRLADAHGFVVAYPDGYKRSWNDCRKAAPYAARTRQIDDVGFARALIDAFRRSHGIDPERVFAVGFSSGGQLGYRLALEAPGTVRAVAAIGASLPTPDNLDCSESGKPVSVLVMNGTDDRFNPFEGGLVTVFGFRSRGAVRSSEDTARYFAGLSGAAEAPAREVLTAPAEPPWVERVTWRGGREVELVTIHGGGHVVPQGDSGYPAFLGKTARGFDGPAEIWKFFARQRAHRTGPAPTAPSAQRVFP